MAKDKALDSLNSGKYFAAAADFIAAFCFFMAWIIDGSIFFLIAAIALFAAGIAIFIVFENFKKKLQKKIDNN
jgi:hypothetical protein